jgi:multidrug efflux pump subunit AcrA (membrane-fusion protein)
MATLGCQQNVDAPRSPEASARSPSIAVVKPARKTIHRRIELPGQIEAFEQTPIYVKIPGYVEIVSKDIGDRVKKGDLLAKLSVPEMDEELKQKAALVDQAQAETELAEQAFQAAKASFETAKAMVEVAISGRLRADALVKRWQSEYNRLTQSSRSTLTQQQLDETERELEAAKAGRAEVEAKIKAAEATRDESAAKRDKAQAEVSAAKARHKVALANHGQMAALLNYANVPAPFDGIVTIRKVDTSHFVQPPTGGRGEPLFAVARIDPVRVFVDVPETDAGFVKDGDAARIRVKALQGQEFAGKVTRNAWALDYSPSKVARTLRTEIDLPNPDGKLRPGMYANVTLVLTRDNVLTLPATAVLMQGDKAFCYRVVDGKPVKTAVQIGLSEGSSVEVMRTLAKPDVWEELTGTEEIVANAASVSESK